MCNTPTQKCDTTHRALGLTVVLSTLIFMLTEKEK
jgi:hypothetical protein